MNNINAYAGRLDMRGSLFNSVIFGSPYTYLDHGVLSGVVNILPSFPDQMIVESSLGTVLIGGEFLGTYETGTSMVSPPGALIVMDYYDPAGAGTFYYWSITASDVSVINFLEFGIAISNISMQGIGAISDALFNNVTPIQLMDTTTTNIINGSIFDDYIFGNSWANLIFAEDGNDIILDSSGTDSIYGGSGFDTCIFNGNSSNYTILKSAIGFSILSSIGGNLLSSVEEIVFDDVSLSIGATFDQIVTEESTEISVSLRKTSVRTMDSIVDLVESASPAIKAGNLILPVVKAIAKVLPTGNATETLWKETVTLSSGSLDEFGKAAKAATVVVNGISAASTAYSTYEETGSLAQAGTDGSIKFLAALAGGWVGKYVGANVGAAATIAGISLFGVSGLPILAGVAIGVGVGFAASYGVSVGIKYFSNLAGLYSYEYGDPEFSNGVEGTVAEAGSGLDAGDKMPKAAWKYNADTQRFQWLDKDAQADFKKVTTAMGVNPNPVGLEIRGDKLTQTKDDYLVGADGADTVRGKLGSDLLAGGDGRDLLLGQAGDDAIFGDSGGDLLKGGSGSDVLNGGAGRDKLDGGGGTNTFDFDALLGRANVDKIVDFHPGKDKIELSQMVFAELPVGEVSTLAFIKGKIAKTAEQHIIYSPKTGQLLYDPDGVGGLAPIKFANLPAGLGLASSDFLIY